METVEVSHKAAVFVAHLKYAVRRFSNLDAVFTEIRIFPCHQFFFFFFFFTMFLPTYIHTRQRVNEIATKANTSKHP